MYLLRSVFTAQLIPKDFMLSTKMLENSNTFCKTTGHGTVTKLKIQVLQRVQHQLHDEFSRLKERCLNKVAFLRHVVAGHQAWQEDHGAHNPFCCLVCSARRTLAGSHVHLWWAAVTSGAFSSPAASSREPARTMTAKASVHLQKGFKTLQILLRKHLNFNSGILQGKTMKNGTFANYSDYSEMPMK